ncbi:MAG: hypothetical protein JXB07_08840 [Anaerolineae bacterium]|nr:hypothetical protein [Anaerolineae bacterium]
MSILLAKLIAVLTTGAVLLFVLSFTAYRRSYYYQKAQAEILGAVRKPGLLSRFVTAGIMLLMILFFAFVDRWIIPDVSYSFVLIFALNLLLIMLLSLFDALFIDYFVLLVWRPAFWRLPEGQPTRDRMMHHIKKQFTVGWLFKVPIALLAAGFSRILHAAW